MSIADAIFIDEVLTREHYGVLITNPDADWVIWSRLVCADEAEDALREDLHDL